MGILDIVVESNFIPSKGEARRLIQQGGLMVNDQKVVDVYKTYSVDDMKDGYLLLKKGKKNFLKIVCK